MKHRKNSLGFSMVEMALSAFMVISISAVTYRVLKNQTSQQMVTMEHQKNNRSSQVAMNRFKTDANMIDPNWVRYGVAPIYPHQGYGLGQNYYLLSSSQQTAAKTINDGVTFLRRNPQSDRLYVPVTTSKRFCYPSNFISGEDQLLFNTNIALDSVSNLAVGDWMLAYQAGNYALGVISQITQAQTSPGGNLSAARHKNTSSSALTSSAGTIRIRMPNSNELQATASNSLGQSTGFVTKAGVVAASYDYTGNLTSNADDNSFCFEASKVSLQKVASPVSYFVDYQTTDGQAKTASNTYQLDQKRGEKIKMLVRAEYVNGVQKREYISQVDEVGFTYDLLNDTSALMGAERIARNVGRVKNSQHLLSIGVSNPSQTTTNFLTSYRIVSVSMGMNAIVKNIGTAENEWKQYKTLKVALDPSLQEDLYRDENTVVSSVTDYLNTTRSTSGVMNQQIGRPLYLLNGANSSEVIVPVSDFEVTSDGRMGSESAGALYVYDTEGCAVNGDSCAPSVKSSIKFTLGEAKFFPNSVVQVESADGSRRILVGGVAMDFNGRGELVRKPSLAIITLDQNETLKNQLSENNPTSTCSIPNCDVKYIDRVNGIEDFVDTALLSVDPSNPDNLYVATMTKLGGEITKSSVFKGTWNGSDYSYSRFASVMGTEEGKLVTAISDRPIQIGTTKYLAVCTTKKISSSCGGDGCIDKFSPVPTETSLAGSSSALGEIKLLKQGDGTDVENSGIVIAKHNYRCSSLNVDNNQNIIVSGRLTSQPISFQSIKQAVANQRNSSYIRSVLYLDEAVRVEGATTYYADYYQVDPSTYSNSSNIQYIGWLTGTSTVEFPDGTFGMVNGNKIRVPTGEVQNCREGRNCAESDDGNLVSADAGKTPGKGEVPGATYTEFSNAGISRVELAGMNDRVVATIETDPNNINNSVISATYSVRSTELPGVYVPGTFYTTSGHPRTTPTPLPAVSPAMSEQSWYQLYQSLMTPRDDSGLNSNMPVFGDSLVPFEECNVSTPKTCS